MSIAAALLVSLTLTQTPTANVPSPNAPPSAEWWSVHNFVSTQLQSRDLPAWARTLAADPATPRTDPAQLLMRYDIFLRAGYDNALLAAIDAIASSKDPAFEQPGQLIDALIGRKLWWPAQHFVERRPTARPGWGYVLVNHLAESMTPDELDIWLANQSAIGDGPFAPSRMAPPFAYDDYWLMLRVDRRNKLGTAAELATQLADQVRKNPADVTTAMRYYTVVTHIQPVKTDKPADAKPDPAWLGETCKPGLAYDSYHLGRLFLDQQPGLTVIFLERSLSLPWTDADQRKMQDEMRRWARAVDSSSSETAERYIRAWTKRDLIAAYKNAGQPDKAQKLLEQVAAEEKTSIPVPDIAQLAGQVQAASGARVIEGRIREAENENKDSYQYWQTRAQYFAGRKEKPQMIEAFEKSLELAKKLGAQPETHSHSPRDYWPASGVLHNYIGALNRLGDSSAAEQLAWRELQTADMTSDYARNIINLLWDMDSESHPILAADNDRLWQYLSAHARWEYTEEHLLQRMATNSRNQPDKRESMWKRGEQLAGGGADPMRSKTLGWVMTRYDAQRRAIPLIEDAITRLPHDEKGDDARRSAQFNLFETYLSLGDWKNAEKNWPAARNHLTPDEQINWLGDIAVQAAAAGANTDAMRLWQQRCTLDIAADGNIDDMIRAGMRSALLDYYQQLAAENPASAGLQRIVASLQRAP